MGRSRLHEAAGRTTKAGTAVHVDLGEARRALAAAGRRTASILRSAGDGSRRAEGLDWTVGEVGAHLVVVLRGYRAAASSGAAVVEPLVPDIRGFRDRLTAVTGSTLALEPARDPAVLADLVVEEVNAFLAATAGGRADDPVPTPWYGPGVALSLAAATGILVGEQLLHGYDVARTVGRGATLDRDHARVVTGALASMLPLALDPEAAAGVTASFEVRIRGGGPRYVVRVDGGAAVVEAPGRGPVDCHISADPVAFLLVAYGRVGQSAQIAAGRLVSWGRRPWLALGFKRLFVDP